jgi:preprotein translocase subunit SecE
MKDRFRLSRIKIFLNEVVAELKKVSWPTGKEVYGTTIVVVSFIFLLAIYLQAIDVIVSLIKKGILNLLR